MSGWPVLSIITGAPFVGEGEKYLVFDTLESARDYAAQKSRDDPTMECLLVDANGRRIETVAGPQ